MLEHFNRNPNCYGCGTCASACPNRAISMLPDEEGFLYPAVERDLCADCGLCREACPLERPEAGTEPDYAMAFLADDPQRGSSGGAFGALALQFWEENPDRPVWGACLTADLSVSHRYIRTPAALSLLQGSKYVQSDPSEACRQVLEQLKEGPVLFSGTPCQCAGLALLAGAYRDRLVLVDLVCGGVASPEAWIAYLRHEVETNGEPIMDYDFRSRAYPFGRGIRSTLMDGRVIERPHSEDLFFACYQRNLISRPSCYRCAFTRTARVSDVTIGDFQGLDKVDPDFAGQGASLVLPHTEKGLSMCEGLLQAGQCRLYPTDRCIQPRLRTPPREIPLRKLLLKDLLTLDSKVFQMKYGKMFLPE